MQPNYYSAHCFLLSMEKNNNNTRKKELRWVYTFDAVKRFDTLSYASQMRIKAFAAYLFILFTPASARLNAREKAWLGARCYKVQPC